MKEIEKQSFIFKLWPIYRHEIKKLVPMLIMIFLLSFNQSTLWNLKDSLIITASGAEVIPFIKVWAILPGALLMTLLFTYLSNRCSQEKIFYLLTSLFLVLYALFAFAIYPFRDQLHPFESAAYLETVLPAGFKGLISMYRYWTFTGFYVICELWNTVVISVLFWSFANEITRLSEARRFYGVLSIGYNGAMIAAGLVSIIIAQEGNFNPSIPLGHEAWEQNMMLLMLIVIGNGLLAMGTFRWMHKSVLNDPVYCDKNAVKQHSEEKSKLSFVESLKHVCHSRYLICISIMVLAYGIVINLAEVVWKDQLRTVFPGIFEYNHYINNMLVIQGVFAIVMSIGVAEMIRRLGWRNTALLSPVLMMLSSLFFFGLLFLQDRLGHASMFFAGFSPVALALFFGAAQNCISKACKYSVFDSTKEMAFIPLSHEDKLMGKTVIDGVGARIGKSGGSVIHQGLLIVFTSVASSAPYVAIILFVVLLLWIISVCSLGKWNEIKQLQGNTQKLASPEEGQSLNMV